VKRLAANESECSFAFSHNGCGMHIVVSAYLPTKLHSSATANPRRLCAGSVVHPEDADVGLRPSSRKPAIVICS
jgi:hypothetical protein